ncbi:MAG TPA: hypothetical protein PL041_05330 [Melioribacteraceae bacterium]|nr:hypothetical protein [Melioribacteraceae bacterium]
MNIYKNALKKHVCTICCDSDIKGRCTLNEEEHCAIELYTDEIVDVIHKNNDKPFEEIQQALRNTICAKCKTRSEDGCCYLREDANCSLDRYFYLIVDIVNKVDLGKL